MKNYFVFFILLISSANYLFAQDVRTARIIDNETQKGVEFAAVSIKGKEIGTYTDFNGRFRLHNINNTDTLVIRHISYKKALLPINSFNDSLISIIPESNSIQEVVIKPQKYKECSIGFSKLDSKDCLSSNKGTEISTLIADDKFKDYFIKEITVKVKEKKTLPFYIKVHIYNNREGKPGDEVIFSNIYRIDDIEGTIRIDIDTYMIIFPPEGVFVGIEWVGVIKNGMIDDNEKINLSPHIKITTKEVKSITFIRTWDRPWDDITSTFQGLPGIHGLKVKRLLV
ncbi:MAG: carboxypeptidase-like regulatory domain-containing protein [Mangrovibacterium sp.]